MKIFVSRINKTLRNGLFSLVAIWGLSSCGDPISTLVVAQVIDAGVGGTGIVRGIITGFGSVFVNGIEFEIDDVNTAFEVDGDQQTNQTNLSIGMMVTIKGTVNQDGLSGLATSLIYDDDIEGPINSTPTFVAGSDNQQKQLSVLGHSIIVDALTTHYENTSFATLALNDVVEVSGYSSAANTLVATLIKKTNVFITNATRVELKGNVSALTPTSFNLNGITITYINSTVLDLIDSQLADTQFVEVIGTLLSNGTISADKIQQEKNELTSDDGHVSLSGVIDNFVDSSNFKINGQIIDASGVSESSPANALSLLADNVSVVVDGTIVNSVFVASEIDVKVRDVKLSGIVNSVSSTGFSVSFPSASAGASGSVQLVIDNSTQFEDESVLKMDPFTLADIDPTNYVELEASYINNQLIVSNIQRAGTEGYELQGRVDSSIANASITVLGVTFSVNSSTNYDGFAGASDFFNSIAPGDNIRIKDENADGIADVIKRSD